MDLTPLECSLRAYTVSPSVACFERVPGSRESQVSQDAGKAIHPCYVEGQLQGGAVQGIGWALNEEFIFDGDGKLDNPGFLDYRIPVASDLPMIDTHIVEVPNPNHPWHPRLLGIPTGICPKYLRVMAATVTRRYC